ncbi:MAG: aldo/keto reductase, partial [Eubacterium sp.]|nr:aldo/keto reductase [Eubacterium sp.]
KWDFAQIQMNYLDWKNQDAKTQYEILTEAGIPVIVMEPVRGGKLADVSADIEEMFKKARPDSSVASWAMRFVASHDNVLTVLSGMNSVEQMMDNIDTFTDFEPIDDREYKICENAAAMMNKSEVIPCTGCDYCADCPKGVKISSIFAAYNNSKTGELTKEKGIEAYNSIDVKADACVSCGKCMGHCPQSIKIPDLMKDTIPNYFK